MTGPFDADRTLSPDEWAVAGRFHQLWYCKQCFEKPTFMRIPCLKNPFDLWIYRELVHRIGPDLIIEPGAFNGGSALYLSVIRHACHGRGPVVSIDRHPQWNPVVFNSPGIRTLSGDSLSTLITEDGNVNGHPVREGFGPGLFEAVEAFLPAHPGLHASWNWSNGCGSPLP